MTTVRVVRTPTADDAAALHALADTIEARDGVSPFGDETWSALDGLAEHDHFALFAGDPPSGSAAAHLARHHAEEWSLEVASIDPDDGALRGLVDQALDTVAQHGGGHVTWWMHGTAAWVDTLALEAGFDHERDLLQLRVPLPLPSPAKWPDDVSVRDFEVGRDEAAWVAVNNRAFVGHPEQGNWTVDTILEREREPWFDPAGFLLAFDADGLAGFCWTKVHHADPPREPNALGEIYVIGADPRWHGRGLGRALTNGGLESLAERGITVGMLYVDGDNEPAVGLYRALGFTDHRVDRAYGLTVGATP
ncbi:MAG: mycothiol synthase [Acidimicrobiia bacterium]